MSANVQHNANSEQQKQLRYIGQAIRGYTSYASISHEEKLTTCRDPELLSTVCVSK